MKKLHRLTLFIFIFSLLWGVLFQEENINASEQSANKSSDIQQSDFLTSNLSPLDSKIIVLDPGHCSVHTGAVGNGLKEEKVVLDIAKACKKELEKYGDVTVYMTRENNTCPTFLNLGDCLTARNNYAQKLGADFLISMHINWDKNSNTKGANVLTAYKSGYHDQICVETQALGKHILSDLHSMGIKNQGLLLRKLKGSRYKNGSLKDYYSIVRNGVLQKIPSIIIEHGYISNSSDCSNFFNTKLKRQALGTTDAKSIISYYGLNKKIIKGNFVKKDNSIYFVTKANKKVTGWIKNDGKWYYFDESGKMIKGFVTLNKKTFYLNPSTCEMTVGWFQVKSSSYLSRGDGTVVKNKVYNDGVNTYLFDSTGRQLKKGMHTLSGKTYYISSKTDAAVKKKIVKIRGSKYYFSSTGIRKTGWIKYKGKKYYFSKKTGKLIKKKK